MFAGGWSHLKSHGWLGSVEEKNVTREKPEKKKLSLTLLLTMRSKNLISLKWEDCQQSKGYIRILHWSCLRHTRLQYSHGSAVMLGLFWSCGTWVKAQASSRAFRTLDSTQGAQLMTLFQQSQSPEWNFITGALGSLHNTPPPAGWLAVGFLKGQLSGE